MDTEQDTEEPKQNTEDLQQKLSRFMATRQEVETAAQELEKAAGTDKPQPAEEAKRGEVSAATVGRMLGLVTAGDFKVLESKIDLLQTRMSGLLAKMDKLQGDLKAVATGSDIERLEMQMLTVKSLIAGLSGVEDGDNEAAREDAEKSQRLRENIVSNKPVSGRKYITPRKD